MPTSTQPAQPAAPDAASHMRASFWSAILARDALIEGDLKEAKRLSNELSEQSFGTLPGDWSREVGEMQQHAASAAMAADHEEAAGAIARVAVACGRCHARKGADSGRVIFATAPIRDPEPVQARMARHESAADDLWVGLVAPSADAWKQGAITLRDLSPQPPVQGEEPVDEAFSAQLHQIKALGLKALSATTVEAQAEIYGNYLSRCAGCHTITAR